MLDENSVLIFENIGGLNASIWTAKIEPENHKNFKGILNDYGCKDLVEEPKWYSRKITFQDIHMPKCLSIFSM